MDGKVEDNEIIAFCLRRQITTPVLCSFELPLTQVFKSFRSLDIDKRHHRMLFAMKTGQDDSTIIGAQMSSKATGKNAGFLIS